MIFVQLVCLGENFQEKSHKIAREENIPGSVTQFQNFRTSLEGGAGLSHILQQVKNEPELKLLASARSHSAHYSMTLLNNEFEGTIALFFFFKAHP